MGVAPVAIAAVVGVGVLGGLHAADGAATSSGTGVTAQLEPADPGTDDGAAGGSDGSTGDGSGAQPGQGGEGWGGPSGDGLGGLDQAPGASDGLGSGALGGSPTGAVPADADQQVGVVTIVTELGYSGGSAAGTGMVLSADGLVLTNNHVVDGATAIEVTVESTGRAYTATVVGTAPDSDVALLQLEDASGLTPVDIDDDGGVTTGDEVTAIGNAEGTGDLVAAAGTVTATDQTMTASTDGTDSETLSGLIELQADVVSGDSGGPVVDDEGEVVGITTAASSGSTTTVAYAIDIQDALVIARQIEAGDASEGVTIGYPAFLGVSLAQAATGPGGALGGTADGTTSGAMIAGVVDGTPAALAGLAAGDTITAVDGTTIGSGDELSSVLAGYAPGDGVTLTWTSGSTGGTRTATVTLAEGPAN
ncbi:trypsin-like peptidase domain-containing protein [Cellulomonas sp. DKR-3]|uniref:Trypsin-like peptidase domain-containing protein n=1 Tax=Cellulomonas fulva TaxID=2835530 RepID=A0ABS5U2N2_9CELL|nr:trypsin-like peptidase domain-containing protein [Cellulomonas fulva]MBT0995576.1 trypsin-like peptidase domain-containing protein [Cellulomonas fulva]